LELLHIIEVKIEFYTVQSEWMRIVTNVKFYRKIEIKRTIGKWTK